MDRFRLDDPDAAEKALLVYLAALNKPRGTISRQQQQTAQAAMQAVLDAIEQPRLPTRSQVEFNVRLQDLASTQAVASRLIDLEWATEDPEPEVGDHDPDPIALDARLVTLCRTCTEKLRRKGDGWEHFGQGQPFESMEVRAEDPEPEVDPAHEVERLRRSKQALVNKVKSLEDRLALAVQENQKLRDALASGRVQVTP